MSKSQPSETTLANPIKVARHWDQGIYGLHKPRALCCSELNAWHSRLANIVHFLIKAWNLNGFYTLNSLIFGHGPYLIWLLATNNKTRGLGQNYHTVHYVATCGRTLIRLWENYFWAFINSQKNLSCGLVSIMKLAQIMFIDFVRGKA